MTRCALTLIEVLISLTIGMLLAVMATTMVFNTWRLSARAMVRVALHDDVSAIVRQIDAAARNCQHTGRWSLESSPGIDGAWGTGDEWASLTFLVANEQRIERSLVFGENPRTELGWFRLRWDAAAPPERGRLRMSRGSAWRSGSLSYVNAGGQPAAATVEIDPLPRRDRQRSLDDNDLRLIPGIDAATYGAVGLVGDAADLDATLTALIAPSTSAEDFRIGWTDRAGRTVVWNAQSGLSVTTSAGSAIAAPGTPWWNAATLILDGDFLDARRHVLAPDATSAGGGRPMLLRLAFTLAEASQQDVPGVRTKLQRQQFAFSFALGPDSPTR